MFRGRIGLSGRLVSVGITASESILGTGLADDASHSRSELVQ